MQLTHLVRDDDAVSPVIGVILMVAITVILAAVIGTFVLGLGDSQQDVPEIAWETSRTPGASWSLTFAHNGGRDPECESLEFVGPGGKTKSFANLGCTNTFATGESVTVTNSTTPDGGGSFNDPIGKTVKIRWTGDQSGRTHVLLEYDVPT